MILASALVSAVPIKRSGAFNPSELSPDGNQEMTVVPPIIIPSTTIRETTTTTTKPAKPGKIRINLIIFNNF